MGKIWKRFSSPALGGRNVIDSLDSFFMVKDFLPPFLSHPTAMKQSSLPPLSPQPMKNALLAPIGEEGESTYTHS